MAVKGQSSDGRYFILNGAKKTYYNDKASRDAAYTSLKSGSTSTKTSTPTTTTTKTGTTRTTSPTTTSQTSKTPSTTSGPQTVTVEKNGVRTTVQETTPGLFGSLGYTYITGGPTQSSGPSDALREMSIQNSPKQSSGPSDALRNLSVGLAQGQQITQEDINAGALKSGGSLDYVGQQNLPQQEGSTASDELRNLSIGMARGDIGAQTTGGQADQINAAYAAQLAQNQAPGTTGAPGVAGPSTPVDATMGGQGIQPQYVSFDGAYFQQTPQGLMAVADPQVLRGLRSGQIPSIQQSPSMTAGLTFGPGIVTANGIVPTSPQQQQTFQGIVDRFGIPETPDAFFQNPIDTIKDIFKTVYEMTGGGSSQEERRTLADEIEDKENQLDQELRDIDDNPWLTEGVRQRQRKKAEEKYQDELGNMYSKMQLLNDIEDDARQQAQFALGTAISMWDSQRSFQQQQVQLYAQQAQNDFDNAIKLRQLALAEGEPATSNIAEYMFAKENGYQGSFYNWLNPTKGGSSSTPGGGFSTIGTNGDNIQISPAAEGWARTILEGNGKVSDIPASEKSIYGGSLRSEVAQLLQSPIMAESQLARVDRQLQVVNDLLARDYSDITGLAQSLPMTKGKSYTVALYNQVKAMLSINAREQMKGSGAISDFEALQLQNSETSLSRTLSNADFKTELEKIQRIFEGARIRHATNAQLWVQMTGGTGSVGNTQGSTYQSVSGNTYILPNQP